MRSAAIDAVAGWEREPNGGRRDPPGAFPEKVQRKSQDGAVTCSGTSSTSLPMTCTSKRPVDHTRMRRVGIYGVPVYLMHVALNGSFKMADVLAAAAAGPTRMRPIIGRGLDTFASVGPSAAFVSSLWPGPNSIP